jgi:hypothetical protein
MRYEDIVEAIEELYREGSLVKALDGSGEPLFQGGQQVYKAVEGATPAEQAFWNEENKVNSSPCFEQALIEVWRQTLVDDADEVELGTKRYPVRRALKPRLREVDFVFDGNEIRGLEENPGTKSRWALMARSGKKVMQFLSRGRSVANVVDGKATLYGK